MGGISISSPRFCDTFAGVACKVGEGEEVKEVMLYIKDKSAMVLLLLPYTSADEVSKLRRKLAEVQGLSPCPLPQLFVPSRVTHEEWQHVLAVHSADIEQAPHKGSEVFPIWLRMRVDAGSQWCTLLIKDNDVALFDSRGGVHLFPKEAVAHDLLRKGTVVSGDFRSHLCPNGQVEWTCKLVHALVWRGGVVSGFPLQHRLAAAREAVQALRRVVGANSVWNFSLVEVQPTSESVPRLDPGSRLLHFARDPWSSTLWAVERLQ